MFLSKTSVLFVAAFCLVSSERSGRRPGRSGRPGKGWTSCNWTGSTCIDDCKGLPDGNYQWCHVCHGYIHCHWPHTYYVPCKHGYVWDDNLKRCTRTSRTCNCCYPEPETCTWTGPSCIRSCTGRKDGDYQSCHGCSIYASCVGGRILYDYRCCAPAWPPLQWDDKAKRCLYKSSTCRCYRENESVEDQLSWSQILKK